MALEAKLVQKLGQSLLMTPQLQQAIKLLQLGRLEYKEAIEKELLENPVLEEAKETEENSQDNSQNATNENPANPSDTSPNDPATQGDGDSKDDVPQKEPSQEWDEYLDNLFSEHRGSALPKGSVDYDERPSLEATLTKTETLQEYLVSQLRLIEFPKEDQPIIQYIIGNIDRDGYLCVSYDDVAEACGCTTPQVERAVHVLKTLDPPGVGSRNLQECLLVQLEDLGLGDSLAAKIVRGHLDKLETRKFEFIMKAEEVAIEQVYQAINTIRELEPKPGRQFADETVRYTVPDLYIYKVGNEYVISLNEDGLPKLRVSPYYLDLIKNAASDDNPNKTYLNERLKAAQFLIKSIHQRQQTILKVAQSVVKFQREFFDFGINRLKPLTLRDVAEDIGMHESTISRVTTNKYAHTPQGVFELKYFFTTGIRTAEGDVSSSAIKERIKKIIEGEPPDNPISDQQIVEMLNADHIDIARRTVAKYRESMKILSSSRRKKLF